MHQQYKHNKEYFEKKFSKRDPWSFQNSNYEQIKYKRELNLLKQYYPEAKNILEIGCAEGRYVAMLKHAFPKAKIIGVDISKMAIQRAKRQVKGVVFIEGDILKVLNRWSNNTFEIIVLSEILYYLGEALNFPEMYTFLKKVKNKLKKDGILISTNVVDLSDSNKMLLVKKPIIESYYTILSEMFTQLEKINYKEYKEEERRNFNYSIRLFRKS